MLPTHPPEGGLFVRLALPESRHSLPEWEVRLGGRLIGLVCERQLHNTAHPFFEAVGIHPITGEKVRLELSTDRNERIDAVRRFWIDPTTFPQHLSRQLREVHGLD
jgi:hypothetical protein